MTLLGELRYAVRSLSKSKVFASVAVVSIALGIGANTAVFSMLDHILLNPLPVRHPEELVQLKESGDYYGSNNGINSLSYPRYEDFRDKSQVFSGVLCRSLAQLSVTFAGNSERATGELVSGSYFQVLGVGAALGRLFSAEEDRTPGGAPVAVLGYGYWKTRYAGDPTVIGKRILVNDHELTIIGVSEAQFEGVDRLYTTGVYIPMMMAAQISSIDRPLENRRQRWVQVFARLKPGISRREAQTALQPLFHQQLEMEVREKEFAKASAYSRQQFLKMTLEVMPGAPGQDEGRQFLAAPLWALMGMVAMVLLISCANVANLMIARATGRQKEIALRLALGASRGRLILQLLTESALVSLAGGLLGLLMLPPAIRMLVEILPQIDPPLKFQSTTPDLRVLVFTAVASLLTAVLFGLTPAVQATRPDLAPTLKDQAGSLTGGHIRWRKLLAAAQVSLSLLLLIGAGLFMRSLQNIKALNPGFEVTNLLSFSVDPTLSGYQPERARLFYRELTQTLSGLPGVQNAALCVVPPLSYNEWDSTVTVEGYAAKPGEDMNPWFNHVSPGFFAALKIPIYAGRDFTERDAMGAPKVAIVNEKFARHYFSSSPAVGRHIGLGGDPGTKTDIEIIGVVRDTRYQTMRQEPPRQVFRPYLQNEWAAGMTAYVRTDRPADQMFPDLRATVRKLNPNLPVYLMKTEERQRDDSLAVEKLAANLSTAFGVLATLLAAVGVYGVMAFVVARRTREIGIRMALGAVTGNVIWLVMREVLLLAGVGILIGLPVAWAGTRLLANQLYGVTPNDPLTLFAATLGIAAIAGLSGYLPARRATRVDPVFAIRCD